MKRLIILSLLIVSFIGLSSKSSAVISSPNSKNLNNILHRKIELNSKGKSIEERVIKKTKQVKASELRAGKETTLQPRKYPIMDDDSKGIWVNIWNYPTDVDQFIKRIRSYKFDTIYLQINRSTTPVFKHQKKVDEILKIAHKNRVKVIGWSYCYLRDLPTDVKKYVEPALYVSPDGERLDGMAADIEENISLWAVKEYTSAIKRKIPQDYPMLAIVFAPKIKPKYPWKYIGENWDVLMPMTYWHGRKHRTVDDVFNFIKHTALELRRLTGKEDLKIHLITDGERTTAEEVKASLKAAKEFKVNAGISLYPEHLAPESILNVMKNFRI